MTCQIDQDVEFLATAVSELESYLLSPELYRASTALHVFGGTGSLSRLTLGTLLIAQARVHACQPDGAVGARVAALDRQISETRDRWRAHWSEKAAREFPTRMTLWQNFLNDYREDPTQGAADYPIQVRWRVMLQLLRAELTDRVLPGFSQLDLLDQTLRAVLVPGAFVWDAEMAAGFPPSDYWFMYGSLKVN